MNIFVSSDLLINHNTLYKVSKLLADVDLTKCTIMTTASPSDRQFVDYAVRKGAEVRVFNVKPFLTQELVSKLENEVHRLILCSDMGNNFYKELFKVCDLKGVPIRLILSEWHPI